MTTQLCGALLAAVTLLAQATPAQSPSEKVAAVLDDWHRAAAEADEARYFSHFTAKGVFMGTDATERWTAPEFRVWAHPHFAKKAAWSFTPHHRVISFSADGGTAWFDEMLSTPKMGPCRGSGVLVLENKIWKIAQYNLSVPIPNPLLNSVVKQIAGSGK